MSDWRRTTTYRLWRWGVISRDRRCVICNATGKLHAHHVNHATYFPELRFEVDNGVALCGACHMNYHCQMNRSYRTKCDEYDFMNFVKLSIHFRSIWAVPYHIDGVHHMDLTADVSLWDRCPNLNKLHQATGHMAVAYERSPDSVVGYVTELATLRYPSE